MCWTDWAVDLGGHTRGDSLDILQFRPAPVQATWLGYAGTTGADFVDYIIADAVVAPDPSAFTEEVVLLPGTFFVTDTTRKLGKPPTHAQVGLPKDGFVFCCFNNNWKITAPVFAVWMRLLAQLPGGVLWLKRPGDAALANLKRGAQQHGIDPARLVWADNVPLDVHLARYGLADLFLDTLPYNAHATSCDALWGGLPVLTCQGAAFAGRVAASLLGAVNLPELVTHYLEDYEALALELARDPALLQSYRDRLTARDGVLFDTTRFARAFEAACARMLSARTT